MTYEMTAFVNMKQALRREGLTFEPFHPFPGGVGGTLSGRFQPYMPARELTQWSQTATGGMVEVTDLMTGEIYPLLGDVKKAERLAFQLACSYQNGGNK